MVATSVISAGNLTLANNILWLFRNEYIYIYVYIISRLYLLSIGVILASWSYHLQMKCCICETHLAQYTMLTLWFCVSKACIARGLCSWYAHIVPRGTYIFKPSGPIGLWYDKRDSQMPGWSKVCFLYKGRLLLIYFYWFQTIANSSQLYWFMWMRFILIPTLSN